jgi:Uma2 family endonuclease
VAEYQRFVAIGAFGEDDSIELLEGWVVEKMPRNPPHDSTISRVDREIRRLLRAAWHVRIQSSLATSDSVPEPDLAVVRGSADDYDGQHPTGADTALVVEVADSSLGIDRDKARIYAEAAIPAYWFVNLADRQVELHTEPQPQLRNYRTHSILAESEELPFELPTGEAFMLTVASLLPKPHPA